MTTVQQEGMIVTTEGEKPVENKKTSYSNWGLSAYGVARAEFGIKVSKLTGSIFFEFSNILYR